VSLRVNQHGVQKGLEYLKELAEKLDAEIVCKKLGEEP
jgi:hypothetical protein